MILPTRNFFLLLLLPSLWLLFFPGRTALIATVAYDLALVALLGFDYAMSAKPNEIVVRRAAIRSLSLGTSNRIGLLIRNRASHPIQIDITDDLPEEFERGNETISTTIEKRSHAEATYLVRPTQRGLFEMGDLHIRYLSVLGLFRRQMRISARDSVKIYPNFKNVSHYELAAHHRRLNQIGILSSRMLGKGSQFESLREYVPGDDLGDVAWKATAKRGKMLIRNYETDRSQNILILLDCGRLMTPKLGALQRLDYAINATLLLTWVAMKQTDNIAMVAFSDQIESYVPLTKGRLALTKMNEALYRLEPRLRESNYEKACQFLTLQNRKRSLIVLFSDVIDPQSSSVLLSHMGRFARRHLPLCVTFQNPELDDIAESEPKDPEECYRKSVAIQMRRRRGEALLKMRRYGVDVIDTDPREVTPKLISRYLEIKKKMRL